MLTAHRAGAALLLILLCGSRSISGLDDHIAVFILAVNSLFEGGHFLGVGQALHIEVIAFEVGQR